MTLKSVLAGLNTHVTETLRLVILQVFLAPAAYLAPRSWAMAGAKALALSLVVLPSPGVTAWWRMRRAFGGSPYRSFQLAWAWIARPFQDFVMVKRVQYGREDVASWKIVEINAHDVARMRASGQSFIVATAHFTRAALLATAAPKVTPGNLVQVGHNTPRRPSTPYDLRLRVHYGTLLKVLPSAWDRAFEFAFTNEDQSSARFLYERLRRPGNIVNIALDAPWSKQGPGSFRRPFAAKAERIFSTGAAQLAKLARCPIVSCVYWRDEEGTVYVEWGAPIADVDNEIETMNRLLDTLEAAIGERPAQYVLDIGRDRRWNAALRRWESLAV